MPAAERAAQVALLEGAAQVALLGRVAHTALLERAARPEQVTRTALLVFSPPAAQAKTLSTPRVRALARAPIRPPRTNNSILRALQSSTSSAFLGRLYLLLLLDRWRGFRDMLNCGVEEFARELGIVILVSGDRRDQQTPQLSIAARHGLP